jgi:hypothetical protein
MWSLDARALRTIPRLRIAFKAARANGSPLSIIHPKRAFGTAETNPTFKNAGTAPEA